MFNKDALSVEDMVEQTASFSMATIVDGKSPPCAVASAFTGTQQILALKSRRSLESELHKTLESNSPHTVSTELGDEHRGGLESSAEPDIALVEGVRTRLLKLFVNVHQNSAVGAAFACASDFFETPGQCIPKYFNMISRPIGLKIIEQRVKDQRYGTLAQVELDLNLMYSNCRDYNKVNQYGDGYIAMAANLERKLTKKLCKMKAKIRARSSID